MIGSTIGTYKITDIIGAGGMGEVFVGEDLMLERRVAIKLLRPELASRPDVVERFRSEAVTLAKLHHTNIASVYAFFRAGSNFFLIMEYVQGWTLQNIVEGHGALAPAVAIGLFQQALDGIGFAHQRHIIHRDLKPSNVMLTDGGVIKVMDFGLARVLGSAHLTQAGRLVGTLEYISPEQIRGEETDARSDIYSLGILLYEMVTGCLPFENNSEYALIRAQVEAPPPSPRDISSAVSPELEQVILQALAKGPKERFQSIEEFSLALTRCAPKTDTRETLSVLLAALQANSLKADPPEIPIQETRLASQPGVASTKVKATRHAEAVDSSAAKPSSSGILRNWKTYLVASLVLTSSAAVVSVLFFLGMPLTISDTSSRPELRSELPVAAVSSETLATEPQPGHAQPSPSLQPSPEPALLPGLPATSVVVAQTPSDKSLSATDEATVSKMESADVERVAGVAPTPIHPHVQALALETKVIPEPLDHSEKLPASERTSPPAENLGVMQSVLQLMGRFFPDGGDFRVEIRLDKDKETVYTEGENLVIHTLSETAAYLHVDYYQADGHVVHLLDGYRVEGEKALVLGRPESGWSFPVTAPFGEEILTVIASQSPLEDGVQGHNQVETASAYIDRLTKSLQEHKAPRKRAGAYAILLTKGRESRVLEKKKAAER
jgi:serine/threonine protein kinase